VEISGTDFAGATAVNFGDTPAKSFKVIDDYDMSAVTPPHDKGCVDMTVATPAGNSSTTTPGVHGFCYIPVPVISGVSPDTGPVSGGNTVTITGSGFKGPVVESVSFGPVNSQSPYTNTADVIDDNTITVSAPASKTAGTVDIQLVTDAGTSNVSTGDQYTYFMAPEVSGISPNSGPISGGTTVTISGTNLDNATAVNFGNTPVTDISVAPKCWQKGGGILCNPWGPEQLQVTSPAGSPGNTDITVTTPGGTSQVVSADEFFYNTKPTIFGVNPNNGPAGNVVTITGEGFDKSSTVSFGSVAATNVTYAPRCVASNICLDGLTVTVPPEQVLTQYMNGGQVDITVTTAGRETSDILPRDQYSYETVPAPVITGVSPGSGVPGTTVNITGTNLSGATEVDFGGKPATNLTVIPACGMSVFGACLAGRGTSGQDTLQVTVPTAPYTITSTSALGQTVDIQVTTRFGGTSTTSAADHYRYFEIPVETGTLNIPNKGTMTVTSDPAGGSILIDGTITGQKTPYTFTNITSGYYNVEVSLNDYTPMNRFVLVNPIGTTLVNFAFENDLTPSQESYLTEQRLSHLNTSLALPTPTPTVTVHDVVRPVNLNPVYTIPSPTTTLTPTVTVHDVVHPVNLNPVYTTPSPTTTPESTIYIPHEATTLNSEQPGSLSVTSTPSGAEIWVNGQDTGQTTPAVLSEDAGSYQVLVNLDCYGVPDTQTVTVNSGQETPAVFSLTRLDTCPIHPASVVTPAKYSV
jgi:hypothetical protein